MVEKLSITVLPVTDDDCVELAALLRLQDIEELRAAGHVCFLSTIRKSVESSSPALTVRVNGDLAFIFGIAPFSLTSNRAAPWLLGTDVIVRHRKQFVKLSPRYVQWMLDAYPVLENLVHVRNTVAVRWLRSVGFTFHKAPLGVNQEFLLFRMVKNV